MSAAAPTDSSGVSPPVPGPTSISAPSAVAGPGEDSTPSPLDNPPTLPASLAGKRLYDDDTATTNFEKRDQCATAADVTCFAASEANDNPKKRARMEDAVYTNVHPQDIAATALVSSSVTAPVSTPAEGPETLAALPEAPHGHAEPTSKQAEALAEGVYPDFATLDEPSAFLDPALVQAVVSDACGMSVPVLQKAVIEPGRMSAYVSVPTKLPATIPDLTLARDEPATDAKGSRVSCSVSPPPLDASSHVETHPTIPPASNTTPIVDVSMSEVLPVTPSTECFEGQTKDAQQLEQKSSLSTKIPSPFSSDLLAEADAAASAAATALLDAVVDASEKNDSAAVGDTPQPDQQIQHLEQVSDSAPLLVEHSISHAKPARSPPTSKAPAPGLPTPAKLSGLMLALRSAPVGDAPVVEPEPAKPKKPKKTVRWVEGEQLVRVHPIASRIALIRSWDPESEITLPFAPGTLAQLRAQGAAEDAARKGGDSQQHARTGVRPGPPVSEFALARRREHEMEQERAMEARKELQRVLDAMSPDFNWLAPVTIILPSECRIEWGNGGNDVGGIEARSILDVPWMLAEKSTGDPERQGADFTPASPPSELELDIDGMAVNIPLTDTTADLNTSKCVEGVREGNFVDVKDNMINRQQPQQSQQQQRNSQTQSQRQPFVKQQRQQKQQQQPPQRSYGPSKSSPPMPMAPPFPLGNGMNGPPSLAAIQQLNQQMMAGGMSLPRPPPGMPPIPPAMLQQILEHMQRNGGGNGNGISQGMPPIPPGMPRLPPGMTPFPGMMSPGMGGMISGMGRAPPGMPPVLPGMAPMPLGMPPVPPGMPPMPPGMPPMPPGMLQHMQLMQQQAHSQNKRNSNNNSSNNSGNGNIGNGNHNDNNQTRIQNNGRFFNR
jgi:hypothetical protein